MKEARAKRSFLAVRAQGRRLFARLESEKDLVYEGRERCVRREEGGMTFRERERKEKKKDETREKKPASRQNGVIPAEEPGDFFQLLPPAVCF